MIANSILDTIGNTPVIPLNQLIPENGVELFAKYEAGNPSLSIKDRIAKAMIDEAILKGKIRSGTLIVDATAGNTGVALAMVCAVKNLSLLLFMPEDASLERRKMFEGFGAKLELTPKEEGIPGALKRADAYRMSHPLTYTPDQFENPANPEAHRQTTAREILEDFPLGVDTLVLGVGTGGSLTGVGGVLKEKFPGIAIYAVEPSASAVLTGGKPGHHKIQQLGHGFIPKNLNRSLIDEVIRVTDEEAYLTTRRLSKECGLLVGISSGANVHAAIQIAKSLTRGKKILTFLCDAGQRYFSIEKYFTEERDG